MNIENFINSQFLQNRKAANLLDFRFFA